MCQGHIFAEAALDDVKVEEKGVSCVFLRQTIVSLQEAKLLFRVDHGDRAQPGSLLPLPVHVGQVGGGRDLHGGGRGGLGCSGGAGGPGT